MSSVALTFEFWDGSELTVREVDAEETWDAVRSYEYQVGEIVSAWRDGEPWFSKCADMREGQL